MCATMAEEDRIHEIVATLERYYEKINIYMAMLIIDVDNDGDESSHTMIDTLMQQLTTSLFPVLYIDDDTDLDGVLENGSYRLMAMSPAVYLRCLDRLHVWHDICNFIAYVHLTSATAAHTIIARKTMNAWRTWRSTSEELSYGVHIFAVL
jgi:hypothetical protein